MAKEVCVINTERLMLRGIDETDTKEIVEWRSDPTVFRYFKSPHKLSEEEHLEWFRNSYLNNENRYDWMCLDKDNNKVGIFGLIRGEEKAEINYILAPAAQHKGYAREALEALIKYACEEWDAHTIIAEIHKDNVASIRLIEKLNFVKRNSCGDFVIYELES